MTSDEFYDARTAFPAAPRSYARVLRPVARPPEPDLSILRLAREVLGAVKPGADVTNINLPASVLDPVSTLEKAVKSMQRGELMADVVRAESPLDRFFNVLRFYFSGLAKERFGKKPYNPVLGEVFRCCFVHRDGGGETLLVAEQVSHHPPITALCLSNATLGFRLTSHTAPEPRFWGNSLEVKLQGSIQVVLECWDNEEYVLTRPQIQMSGFLLGKQRLEFCGPTLISCERSGLAAEIEFKAKGMLGVRGEMHAVSGRIFNSQSGATLYTLEGNWDGQIVLTVPSSNEKHVLYDYDDIVATKSMVAILPAEHELEPSYSTVVWAECSEAICRGDSAAANEAKRRVEDRERAKRREREAAGVPWEHHYFRRRNNGHEGYELQDGLRDTLAPRVDLPADVAERARSGALAKVNAAADSGDEGGGSKAAKPTPRRKLMLSRNKSRADSN